MQSTAYDPYGRTVYSAGEQAPRYQFTRQELDAWTGLYYYGARYYDPQLGRFLQADTYLDGLNRYAYCGNNPVNYVDPTGMWGDYHDPSKPPGEYHTIVHDITYNDDGTSDVTFYSDDGTYSTFSGIYDQDPGTDNPPPENDSSCETGDTVWDWFDPYHEFRDSGDVISLIAMGGNFCDWAARSSFNNAKANLRGLTIWNSLNNIFLYGYYNIQGSVYSVAGMMIPRDEYTWGVIITTAGMGPAMEQIGISLQHTGQYAYSRLYGLFADDVVNAGIQVVDDVGGTVWNSIKGTQGTIPGTNIPKSFTINAGNDFWVHPNATKHMAEFFNHSQTFTSPVSNQSLLRSFQSSLETLSAQGFQYDTLYQIGSWELKIGAPLQEGMLPTV